ncbi:thioredoxin-dependent thiol peroxidase [Paraglaciecola hydrolytica]|uniref:thioredoxin-dependent peroxiredoxin n=1 Tax=Paraglaciecola hydrolytica TaxID=1799789 RepID=A0A136A138_9ALTE|nr:thioredoxin-dependent thiol peroxidase [Paraglaciecola hydrolytica]KXI28923.1 bacterioferritin comigratory protein [Paraglaciecola hydrolytica]
MQMLQVGEQVAEFSLADENNHQVSLSQLRGKKVLLYFYPKAMTPGCTIQAQGLRDSKTELDKHNVVVFGISPDAVKRLPKFIEKQQLNFSLLSDEDHSIADTFGVWGPKKFMGREFDGIHRISFLLDENGKVAQVFDKFTTKNHHEVVLDYLNSK